MKILVEASGSLVSAYLIKSIQDAGEIAVASDIDTTCVGKYIADDFLQMPSAKAETAWNDIYSSITKNAINVVIPSFDETLSMWANYKPLLKKNGIDVILSDLDTIKVFQDKWLTYLFFKEHHIPTPKTSLKQEFMLTKPRLGRGSEGISISNNSINMEGMISQEYLQGEEYTIDVFCDRSSKPVYIVPRKRIAVREGKSTGGIVVNNPNINNWVEKICSKIDFLGPINIQCFVCHNGDIKFIEVNPRIAGGMALAFAATENWVTLIIEHFIKQKVITPKEIQYGLQMRRYYSEVFFNEN